MKTCFAEWFPFIGSSAVPDTMQKESASGEHQHSRRGQAANFLLIYLLHIFLLFHDPFVVFQGDFNFVKCPRALILWRLGINKPCIETGVLIKMVIKWAVNGRSSTAFSVSSFGACMLLNLLKSLFIMFKCHFAFLLIRSLISSFASNWTSACEVKFWLSVKVSSMPDLNTEPLRAKKDLTRYFALKKGLLVDKPAMDSCP